MSDFERDTDGAHPAELLLPWYVAGTLSPAEKAEVEAWLKNNPEAQAHLARVQEESFLAIESAEEVPMPRAAAIDDLMARLGIDGRSHQTQSGIAERIWAMLSPRWALAGAAALALAVIAQGTTIGMLMSGAPQSQFETASGGAATFAGPSALVAFQSTRSVDEITAYLTEHGLTITDGPRAGGIYRIAAADSDAGRAALTALGEDAGMVRFFAPASQ